MAKKLRVQLDIDYTGKQAIATFTKDTGKAKKETGGLTAKLRDFTVIATGVVRGLQGISRAFSSTIAAASRQDVAEVRLAVALRNSNRQVETNVNALKAFAAQRQAVTNFGDEWTLELATLGVALGDLAGTDLERALVAIQDFEAAGKSGRAMLELLSRAAAGGTADFSRYGLVVDKNLKGTEKFESALSQLEERFGGTAVAVGKLATSKLAQLDNTFGDLLETVGRQVAQTKTYQAIILTLKGSITTLDAALADSDGAGKWIASLDAALLGGLKTAQMVFTKIILFAADAVESLGAITSGVLRAAKFLGLLGKNLNTDQIEALQNKIELLQEQYAGLAEGVVVAGKRIQLTDIQIRNAKDSLRAALTVIREEIDSLNKAGKVRVDFEVSGEGLRKIAQDLAAIDIESLVATATQSAAKVVQGIGAKGLPAGDRFMAGFGEAVAGGMALVGDLFSFDFGEQAAAQVEKGIGPWRGGIAGLAEDFDNLIRGLPEGIEQVGDVLVERLEGINLAEVLAHEEQMTEVGQIWADTLAASMSETILEGGGFDDLMQNMGSDLGTLFVQEFTSTVVDPLRMIFGELASAAAEPFRLIAKKIVTTLLKPVTNILGEMLSGVASIFAEILGGQVATTGAAATAVGVVMAANVPLAAQLTGMAAANAIATFGLATASAAGAILAVKAAALSGAIPFGEEGMVVSPSPGRGGVLVAVAEHEPEIIAPLSKAKQLLGGGGGMQSGMSILVPITIESVGGGISESDAAETGEAIADAVDAALHERFEGTSFARGLV